MLVEHVKNNYYLGFIILAIIGIEHLIVTEVDGQTNGGTEIQTPISHPAISRCDKK